MSLFEARSSAGSAQKSDVDAEFLETVNSLIDDQASRLFEPLFRKFSTEMGKQISKLERAQLGLEANKSLVYGEVDFSSFVEILRKVGPSTGKKFYDLGSGTGRAVMAARITQDYSVCVGIESLSSLYSASLEVNQNFSELIRQFLSTGQVLILPAWHPGLERGRGDSRTEPRLILGSLLARSCRSKQPSS